MEVKRKTDPEDFAAEMADHLDSGLCDINYEGSSNAMEMDWAIRLWQRSLENTKCNIFIWSQMRTAKHTVKFRKVNVMGKMLKLRKLILLDMFKSSWERD